MRSLIIILCIIAASTVKAQPPVRISVDDFMKAIANHPELVRMSAESEKALVQSRPKKENVKLTDMEKSMLELERRLFSNDFKSEGLLCFQTCWMLEQQINEAKHFQSDVLALKIAKADVLLKQEVITRESKLQVLELESKRKEKLKELNALVHHEYGDQPVLPEGWVWSFNGDVSASVSKDATYLESANQVVEAINTLSESFVQVNAILALQEKFISKMGREESLAILNELSQLNNFKKQRWEIFGQIADKKAELYNLTATYPSGHDLAGGSN